MNIVEVKFDNSNTTSFFRNKDLILKNNLTVIVNTDRGLQFGRVVRIISTVEEFEGVELDSVVRIASKKDYFHHLENMKLTNEVLRKCRQIVSKNELNMTILDASYNFERTQLLFRFVAEERVDFRQLAKELGATFRARIELRQIGIRDKAKEVGGIGPCGRRLCCSSFLKNFDSITINMAKNQNVSLNPTKINGVCGRLLCCLKYENDTYNDLKKGLPKVGAEVKTAQGIGKVISINLLNHSIVVELENKSKMEVVEWIESKK